MRRWSSLLLSLVCACASGARERPPPVEKPVPAGPPGPIDGHHLTEHPESEARHLRNIRQLTLDGKRNVESLFSPDGKHVLFHSVRGEHPHHQVFTMDLDGSDVRLVSTGKGLAVCGAWAPDRPRVLFASTHAAPNDDVTDAALDVFEADVDGNNLVALAASPGFDGEASYAPDGKRIVFSSTRDGDQELYVQELDGAGVRRLTHAPGRNGSASFSPDGTRLVFRRGTGTTELWLINADGTGERQLTSLGALAWDPIFHPGGKHVLFSSNHRPSTETPGENFDLYLLSLDDGVLERITYDAGHDTLPAFSRDGKWLTWTSSRQGGINQIFVAEWID